MRRMGWLITVCAAGVSMAEALTFAAVIAHAADGMFTECAVARGVAAPAIVLRHSSPQIDARVPPGIAMDARAALTQVRPARTRQDPHFHASGTHRISTSMR